MCSSIARSTGTLSPDCAAFAFSTLSTIPLTASSCATTVASEVAGIAGDGVVDGAVIVAGALGLDGCVELGAVIVGVVPAVPVVPEVGAGGGPEGAGAGEAGAVGVGAAGALGAGEGVGAGAEVDEAVLDGVLALLVAGAEGATPGAGATADMAALKAFSSVRNSCRFVAILASMCTLLARPLVPTAPDTPEADCAPIRSVRTRSIA